jgi:hypothetical protein
MQRPLPDFGSYEINGKFYNFRYKPDLSTNELDKLSPILKNDELAVYAGTAGPVVYTWIICSTRNPEERVLYAREAKDRLELLSKHMVIDYEVSCNNDNRNLDFAEPCIDKVLYAGEMTIDYKNDPPTGRFNTLSGTYMMERDEALIVANENKVIENLLKQLTGISFEFVGNDQTMITAIPNIRDVYETNVVDIYEYNTKEELNDLKTLPRQILREQEMIRQRMRYLEKFDPELQTIHKKLNAFETRLKELLQKKPLTMGGKKTRRKRKSNRKSRR